MKDYKNYYEKNLYPLQDGILNIAKRSNVPFFLTGGTALSRGYLEHRYSDDLDFFLNNSPDFDAHLTTLIDAIQNTQEAFQIEIPPHLIIRRKDYCTFQILEKDTNMQLKIDCVNDIDYRVGTPLSHPELGLLDTWQNILTNKLGALLRFEAKDYADLWAICTHYHFEWPEMFHHAQHKDAGLDSIVLADIIRSIPIERLSEIKWAKRINLKQMKQDLMDISRDILYGGTNSLSGAGSSKKISRKD